MKNPLKKYRKAVVAVAGVGVVVCRALLDGSISGAEAVEILTAVAVATGVYRIPNAQ